MAYQTKIFASEPYSHLAFLTWADRAALVFYQNRLVARKVGARLVPASNRRSFALTRLASVIFPRDLLIGSDPTSFTHLSYKCMYAHLIADGKLHEH